MNVFGVLPSVLSVERARELVLELFGEAGITVGSYDSDDVVVHDPMFYVRVLRDGSLGVGESYMDGWWDARSVDGFIYKLLMGRLDRKVMHNWRRLVVALRAKLTNVQSSRRSFEVGERHYDIGNDLYRAMLGETLAYTCAYWRGGAADLDEAQEAKLDLVCRKVGLERGMRVLELGCGWGSFARFAAANYGVEVTGYTVSREQVELGMERCKGLPVTLHLADYREASGSYDAVISIGIMEHVGPRNYRTYMELVDRCMVEGGVGLVHTIGGNRSNGELEPWFDRYIFPGAVLPTVHQVGKAVDDLFVVEDIHNFGPDYDRTLMAWHQRFEDAWAKLQSRYDERFHRMWRYYLLSCAASFRARYTQLFQMVFTRPGTPQPECRLG